MSKCGFLVFLLSISVFAQERRNITLEWEDMPDAAKYEIEIANKVTSRAQIHTTTQPKWIGGLPRGTYQYRIRGIDERGVPGPWSDFENLVFKLPSPRLVQPEEDYEIVQANDRQENIQFRWLPVSGAHHYRLKIESSCSPSPIIVDTAKTEALVALAPACEHHWHVTTYIDSQNEGSTAKGRRKISIISGVTKTPKIEEPKEVPIKTIQWSKVDHAEYRVTLFKLVGGDKWVQSLQKAQLANQFDIPEEEKRGIYQLVVTATVPFRKESSPTEMVFELGTTQAKSDSNLEKYKNKEVAPITILARYGLAHMNFYSDINVDKITGSVFSLEAMFNSDKPNISYQYALSSTLFKVDRRLSNTFDLRAYWQYSDLEKWKISVGGFLKNLPRFDYVDNALTHSQFGAVGPSFGIAYSDAFQDSRWTYIAHAAVDIHAFPTSSDARQDGEPSGAIKTGYTVSRLILGRHLFYTGYMLAWESGKIVQSDSFGSTNRREFEYVNHIFHLGTSFLF